MRPPASVTGGIEICHDASRNLPTRPPASAALVPTRTASTAIRFSNPASISRVAWANGPSNLIGPSVTNSSVKIAASPSCGTTSAAFCMLLRFRSTRFPLFLQHSLLVAIEEIGEKSPDYSDGSELAHVVPARRHRGAHDVGGQLESESRDQPGRKGEPHLPALKAACSREH